MKFTTLRPTVLLFFFAFVALGSNAQDTTQTHATDTVQVQPDTNTITKDTTGVAAPVDSTQLLKAQERAGKISGQLARDRTKLAELEKDFVRRTEEKEKAVKQAESSADENRAAAIELSNDAANRSKARKAEKSARRARRDAQSVQRADKNLEQLQKNIRKVKKEIEDNEKALKELQGQL